MEPTPTGGGRRTKAGGARVHSPSDRPRSFIMGGASRAIAQLGLRRFAARSGCLESLRVLWEQAVAVDDRGS